jgi:hypothetical protein
MSLCEGEIWTELSFFSHCTGKNVDGMVCLGIWDSENRCLPFVEFVYLVSFGA